MISLLKTHSLTMEYCPQTLPVSSKMILILMGMESKLGVHSILPIVILTTLLTKLVKTKRTIHKKMRGMTVTI